MRRVQRSQQSQQELTTELQQINRHAAGIDIGATSHFVAVSPSVNPQPVREFGAFTPDLHHLADWLQSSGVETVAMESTGVYWIPVFEVLEQRGLEVKLVDPRQLKRVPGRKTDVLDCQWLQQLHSFGLLAGAFRPPDQVCVLRGYLRQRQNLVQSATREIQHIQKALTQMNVQLHHALTDITGTTGMAIIRTILAGERDPRALAKLRDYRCKNDEATIAKALEGTWREEHLFALQQAVELYDIYKEKIQACDARILATLETFYDRSEGAPVPKRPKDKARKRRALAPDFDLHPQLFRMTGVDVTSIDGIQPLTALQILSEIGIDPSPWPTEKHFTSWLGLCPGSKKSGGKMLSSRTKSTASRAAAAFRIAAQSLHHSRSALGAYYRRMKARLGGPEAITATAHKLARIFYALLKYGHDYVDPGQHAYEQQHRERAVKALRRRARELGFHLVTNQHQVAAEAPP